MSSRRQARKRTSLEPKTTPINPLRTRGFGKGIQARNAQLPHVNPLQTRPFGAQKPGLSQTQETHSLQEQQEQKEGTEQFGYNAANIPAYAPGRSQLPIQTKAGQLGGWNPPPIQRVNPVKNRLNLWRDQQLGQAETGESEDVSEREDQEVSPEAVVVQRLQESDTQPIPDKGIQPQEIAESEDKETPTSPPKAETIQPKSVNVAKTISPQTKAQLRRKLFPESQDETEKIPEFSTNVDREQQSSSVVEAHKKPLAKAKQFANLPAKVGTDKKLLTSLKTNRPTSLAQTFKPSEADQLIEPGDTAEANGVPSISNKTPLPDAGGVPHPQSPETAAPPAAISSPAAAGGGGGAGGSGASAGGGDVEAATVDEEAEANAMEERLAEVAPETDTESNQLSSAEKDVALAALAEEPATGSLPAGGGGGGGAIAESAPPPAPPDVSQADPAAALGAVSGLPPAQLVSALGGVTAAVSNDVGKQKSELAANPPTADTLAGTGKSAVVKADSGGDNPKPVAKKAEGQEKPVPEPKPLPPEKAPPQVSTPAPTVQGNEEGKLSDADISNMKASVTRLPVRDPGANQVSPGPPPKLALEGNADPQKAQEQRAELETSLTEAQVKGQQELAKPTGVEDIQPTIPQKTLKAQITGGAGGGAAGAAAGAALATGAGGDGMGDAASIFAQQEKGGEIQAAAAQAQSDLAAKKQDHAIKVAEEQATAQQEVEQLKQDNIAQQAQERTKAKGEVAELQGQWSKEQDDLVSQSRKEGDKLVSEGLQEVETKQAEGDAEAAKEIEKGETEAEAERQKGEAKAAEEKQKGEEESSGLFGWLASKAKAFFDGIKKAIQKAFEAARAAMRKAIEAAKKLAAAAIEKARQGIVAVIRRVGDALIALGDTLLAKWPGLRDKWRSAIAKKVQQAEDAVNKLAENLNQGIQKALDVLGGALDAALGLLEKGMLAVVSVYQGVVMGAIKLGEGIAKALGAFAVLAKDIAANPGQWISNLGAAVSDGIRNHLWSAFKEQVQIWFNQKLEAVLGLGAAVWNILTQGGIAMAEVGKMAWTAVKQALPTIIIGVLLERLVSMIVPAAGAVLAIIQGLQAAWGTVSQIIQAFGRFIEFLKAIKTGAAGPQFGALLASAAIVLLDFITNFIIVKIAKAARKVAGKLKGLAKSLMKRFKGKGKKGTKDKKRKDKKEKDKNSQNQEKLDRAVRELQPKIGAMLKRGVSSIHLRAKLAMWRVKYRLKKLSLEKQGANNFQVVAQVNPKANVLKTFTPTQRQILRIVHKIGKEMLNSPEAKKAAQSLAEQREKGAGNERANPLVTESGVGNLGAIRDLRNNLRKRKRYQSEYFQVGNDHITSERHTHKSITEGTNFVSLSHKGSTYPDIKNHLDAIHGDLAENPNWKNVSAQKREGLIAIAIWNMARGKKVPQSLTKYTKHFAQLNRLIFHVEGSRDNAATVFSPMLVEMIGKREMSFAEAFNGEGTNYDKQHGYGGLFPPSQQGAVAAMNRVNEDSQIADEEIEKNNNKRIPVKPGEQARRQVEFIERWIEMKMKEQKLNFNDEATFERFVKEEFEKELRKSMNKFFGLSPT